MMIRCSNLISGHKRFRYRHVPFMNLATIHSFPVFNHHITLFASPLSNSQNLYTRSTQHTLLSTMDSNSNSTSTSTDTSSTDEVAYDLSPILKVYKNGRIERLAGEDVHPTSLDPTTNVQSKDVVISEKDGISARLFLPKTTAQKLPLLVYIHGGAFCIETPFSKNYHNLLNKIVSMANVIAVSVHYRRAPEHPVPIAHEDSWEALKWVASHVHGSGSEEWLNGRADFGKVFFAGDSAGANISHYLGIRVGTEGLPGVKVEGIVLVHPYFWGAEPIGREADRVEQAAKIHNLWRFACPNTSGSDDLIINPGKDPKLGKLACERVLVCVAEKDLVRDRGLYYKELLEKSGWKGVAEVQEMEDEDHVFHMFKPSCEKAQVLLNQIVSFIKLEP